jgi:phospholipase C
VSPIKHVIVLMEENRSFDHLFGFYTNTKVNGLTGKEFNLVDPTNPDSVRITVNALAEALNPCDPDHGTPATSSKIFGNAAAKIGNFTTPAMSGFVEWENFKNHSGLEYCGVMSMMSPEHVPILTTLASEFAIMDRFFCSVPGPTWPNRLFALSATSAGLTETGPWYHNEVGNFFPQKTFFDQVAQANLTWKNYYNDTPWEMFLASLAHAPEHLRPMEEFWEDARTGNLPSFAWLNPRSGINITTGVGSNDQHPDHDLNAGEQYYKDIYEALRASPAWNDTLFIITFDEHGGFYDHVGPPEGVPPPDNETSYPDKDFKFDRLGIRIPTLLISPWIPKGTVISRAPAAQNPSANSEYDLTSIMASARKLLGIDLPPLTARDAWSSTFEHVVSANSPRTDCPEHLPPALPPKLSPHIEANLPLNDLQNHIAAVLSHLSQSSEEKEAFPSPPLKTQGHLSVWAQHHMRRHRHHHAKKQASKLEVVCLPVFNPTLVERYWNFINHWPSTKFYSLQTKTLKPPVCLAVQQATNNATLIVAPCTYAENPDEQSWILMPDTTLRPALDLNLCATNAEFQSDVTVRLTPCAVNVNQHWGYHGPAPGNDGSGFLYFGDFLNALSLRDATR